MKPLTKLELYVCIVTGCYFSFMYFDGFYAHILAGSLVTIPLAFLIVIIKNDWRGW